MDGFEETDNIRSRSEINDPAASAYTAYDADKDRAHDYWFNGEDWSDLLGPEPTPTSEAISYLLLALAVLDFILVLPVTICSFRLGWPVWILPVQILSAAAMFIAAAYLKND